MFRLKQLILKDFMSFEDITIDFNRRGFYLIQGHNNKGGDSNGAGKTAILSGIVWTLFGKTQAGLQGKDVVRWGEKSCTGILTLISGEHTYQILRSTETLEFFIDGTKQSGHKKDLQDIINNAFGTDYNLFITFNIFTKYWSKFITEVGDADRKKLFKNILMLHQLDNAYDRAKKIYANLMVQASKTEGIISNFQETIPTLKSDLNKYQEHAENENKAREQAIRDIESKKKLLEPTPIDFSEEMETIGKELGESKSLKLDETLEFLNIQLTNIRNLIYKDEQDLIKQAEKIRSFSSTNVECPTCGQNIPPRHRQAYRRQLELIQQELNSSFNRNVQEREDIENKIYGVEDKIKHFNDLQIRKNEIDMAGWQQQIGLDKYNEFCKTADETIEKLKTTATNYGQIIDDLEKRLSKTENDLKANQSMFESYKKEIDIFNYLIWLYSRQGVISVIIEKCFSRLKFLSNKFLMKLSSEGFKIDISPQKSLKSGELRDEIDLFILDRDKKIPYNALSAGQQQRINTAMMLALYTWGREIGCNNFDFILLDEVLDLSIAAKGQEDIINLIYDMRPHIYHTFLITHKDILSGKFDQEIKVLRDEKGISKLI